MSGEEKTTIRVDVQLQHGATLYFFVRRYQSWNSWWAQLFAFLNSFAPPAPDEHALELLPRRDLSVEETASVLRELRSAPEAEVSQHRSLRKTIDELSRVGSRCSLVFFRDTDETDPNKSAD